MSPSATHPEEDYHDDYEDNLDDDECFPLMIIQLNLMMMVMMMMMMMMMMMVARLTSRRISPVKE